MRSVCITDPPYNADLTGGADCRDAVQRALDDVGGSGGGEVLVPSGLFQVQTIPGNNLAVGMNWPDVVLRGTGQSILYCPTIQGGAAAGDGCGVIGVAGNADMGNIQIKDITFRNAGTYYTPYDAGLALIYIPASGFTIYDLTVQGCRFETRNRSCLAIGCPVVGFDISHNVMPCIGETGIYLAGTTLGIGGGVRHGSVHHNRMGPVLPPTVGAPGISVRCTDFVAIHHNYIDGADNVGINCRGPAVHRTDIEHNHVVGCAGGGIMVGQGEHVTVARNLVVGTTSGSSIYVAGWYAPISDVRVLDNSIAGSVGYSINVENQTARPLNVEVRGNWVSPDNAEGIALDGCDGLNRIEDNTILFAAGGNGSPGMRVMNVAGSVKTLVRRNFCRGHTAWGNGCYLDPACVAEGNDFAA